MKDCGMYHEPANTPYLSNDPKPETPLDEAPLYPSMMLELPAQIEEVLAIERFISATDSPLRAEDDALIDRDNGKLWGTYVGKLQVDRSEAYKQLDQRLKPFGMFALLRHMRGGDETRIMVHIVAGRPPERARQRRILPLVLLIATLISVLLTGTLIAAGEIGLSDGRLSDAIASNPLSHLGYGIPYAFAIMLILGSHELGHYFTMRRYGLAGSFPYFIPAPLVSPFGTFGATIVLRDALRNRNMLFDLGASGPLAGMFFAIPILLIGLATSPVMVTNGGIVEGNSILYALAKIITLGEFLPNNGRDVLLNQWAWAGWTGFFVTALNLIPLGQLDGGHILYALLGDNARRLYYPLLVAMIGLTLFVSSAWLIFGLLLVIVGRFYAIPLDDISPLSPRRRKLGIAILVMFGLIFTPIPIGEYGANNGLLAGLLGTIIVTRLWRWTRHKHAL